MKKKQTIESVSIMRQMERMMGGAAKGSKNEYAAQDLVYDAGECADPEDAFDLLEQAVEIDPTNIDAWLGLMNFAPMESDERIEFLRKLVKTGEANLGKAYFKNNAGYFWGVLETRPYMRARSQLALRLMDAGKIEESTVEHEEMLKLNANDNQGIRYGLMACYLTLQQMEKARRLFKNYKDDREYSAVFAWAHVLERFLSDDRDGALKSLGHAQKQNGHAMAYFLEHRKLPKSMPDSYSMGSREEAIIAWDILKPAWKAHPEAQVWLEKNRTRT